jgi:hypothetical protein
MHPCLCSIFLRCVVLLVCERVPSESGAFVRMRECAYVCTRAILFTWVGAFECVIRQHKSHSYVSTRPEANPPETNQLPWGRVYYPDNTHCWLSSSASFRPSVYMHTSDCFTHNQLLLSLELQRMIGTMLQYRGSHAARSGRESKQHSAQVIPEH